jgi:hypothetical protein
MSPKAGFGGPIVCVPSYAAAARANNGAYDYRRRPPPRPPPWKLGLDAPPPAAAGGRRGGAGRARPPPPLGLTAGRLPPGRAALLADSRAGAWVRPAAPPADCQGRAGRSRDARPANTSGPHTERGAESTDSCGNAGRPSSISWRSTAKPRAAATIARPATRPCIWCRPSPPTAGWCWAKRQSMKNRTRSLPFRPPIAHIDRFYVRRGRRRNRAR